MEVEGVFIQNKRGTGEKRMRGVERRGYGKKRPKVNNKMISALDGCGSISFYLKVFTQFIKNMKRTKILHKKFSLRGEGGGDGRGILPLCSKV